MNINDLPSIELTSTMKNLTNYKQGKLTFLKPAERKNNKIFWWTICDCGNIQKIRNDSLATQCKKCRYEKQSKERLGKPKIDLTGKVFGLLTVLYSTAESGHLKWHCKCECGVECDKNSQDLISGNTKSCGCLKKIIGKKIGEKNKKDLTNRKFGYLMVIKDSGRRRRNEVVWECKCECGKTTYVAGSDLTNNSTRSCGCKKGQLNGEKHTIPMIGKVFGKLTVLEKTNKDKDGTYNYLCQCECGNKKIINGCSLRQGITTSCGCIQYSIGEKNIKKILDNNNIKYKKEYYISELNNKRFDFAILKEDKVIRFVEFDGRQHFEKANSIWEKSCSFEERQQRDKIKNQWAKDHNIPLVRIPYWERDNITLEMIMGDQYLVKDA